MPDTRFFDRSGPYSLAQLAEIAGGTLADPSEGALMIEDVAPLDEAGAGQLSFFDNRKYRDMFRATRAAACLVSDKDANDAPDGVVLIICAAPYTAYARVAQAFYPDRMKAAEISAHAAIAKDAQIGADCRVEAGAVIGEGARIGAGCWIEAGAVIGPGVQLGDHCRIGVNASVSHALLGHHVRLYPGARVGQDGFGFAMDPSGFVKVPQLGRVIIGNHVEIGANSCIDRGAGPDTVIGDGVWIDNLVQIGHNVKIGRGCVLVSQSGVAGSTVLEDYVVLAAQAGVAGHLRIGKGARIGAKAGVMRDTEGGQEYLGAPALPIRQFMRQIAVLNRLSSQKDKEK